jgi:hypothetical protein
MMLSILMTTLGHRDLCIIPSIDPSKPKIMPQILLITLVTKIPPLSLDRPWRKRSDRFLDPPE